MSNSTKPLSESELAKQRVQSEYENASCWAGWGDIPSSFKIWSQRFPMRDDPLSLLLGHGETPDESWIDAASKLPQPLLEDGIGEGIATCKFDDAPIYKAGDGWFHYADFEGDHFHEPEPKVAEPAFPVVAASDYPSIESVLEEFARGEAYGKNSHFIREFSKKTLSYIESLKASRSTPVVVPDKQRQARIICDDTGCGEWNCDDCHPETKFRNQLAPVVVSVEETSVKLLADVMYLWIDDYIGKSSNSMAPVSIAEGKFQEIEQFLFAHGITVDYCGVSAHPSSLPTDDSWESGFNRCKDLAMHIVDEHPSFLDRIGYLDPITARPKESTK